MFKGLSIFHSALHEEEISNMVALKIKEKENLLCLYQKEDKIIESGNTTKPTKSSQLD